jgi:hypothetical protein
MAQWIKSLRASLSSNHLYRPIGGLPDHKRKTGDVDEEKTLLADDEVAVSAEPEASHPRVFVILSCILNVILLFLLILRITHAPVKDPTLQVWCKLRRTAFCTSIKPLTRQASTSKYSDRIRKEDVRCSLFHE